MRKTTLTYLYTSSMYTDMNDLSSHCIPELGFRAYFLVMSVAHLFCSRCAASQYQTIAPQQQEQKFTSSWLTGATHVAQYHFALHFNLSIPRNIPNTFLWNSSFDSIPTRSSLSSLACQAHPCISAGSDKTTCAAWLKTYKQGFLAQEVGTLTAAS